MAIAGITIREPNATGDANCAMASARLRRHSTRTGRPAHRPAERLSIDRAARRNRARRALRWSNARQTGSDLVAAIPASEANGTKSNAPLAERQPRFRSSPIQGARSIVAIATPQCTRTAPADRETGRVGLPGQRTRNIPKPPEHRSVASKTTHAPDRSSGACVRSYATAAPGTISSAPGFGAT